jgi:nitrite reductase/ring-hydroxylating ferredoxin subunit
MPKAHPVCDTAQIPPGGRKIVEIAGKSIGVFNVHGQYYALRNICPHQFAPLCLGKITGTTRPGAVGEYHWEKEGEIIRCPWHGWEFDIRSGHSVFNPHKVRAKSYKVTVERPDGTRAEQEISFDAPDPAVESFAVTAEAGMVYVHV